MRKRIRYSRLVVLLGLFLPVGLSAQEYYTRTSGHAIGGPFSPIIGNESISGSQDIRVFPSSSHQTEISIAVNWCYDINMLIGANTVGAAGYAQGYYYTEDCGLTWSGGDQLPGIGYYTSDPAVAFDVYNVGNPNGYSNGFFNYLEFGGFTYDLKVNKTTDGGRNWLPAVSIPSVGDPDKNHMTSDPTAGPFANNLYVGFTDFSSFPGSPVRVSRSTNLGGSFSTPVNISLGTTSLFSQGVNLNVGPAGEVYAVWAIYDDWNDLDPNVWDEEAIGFARSLNGGATWESPRRIREIDGIRNRWTHKNSTGDLVRVNSFPVIAVDRSGGPHTGTIYLVWPNKGEGADKSDIHLSRSTDGGSTWSSPLTVNDDNTDNDQWMPWVTVSPFGRVTIVFYDSRNDLTPPLNQATETWIAESVDGGLTFTNTRVSDISFVPVPVPNTATGYMGDYIGITSKAGSAYPAWADNRTGVYQVYLDIHDTYMQDLGVLASQSRSSVRYATAYGSGPKLVFAGNRWHRLFHMNEHLAYAQSTDDGATWSNSSLINGSAVGWLSNPSLHESGGSLHAVFRTDIRGVYYLRGTIAGVWEEPRLVKEVDGVINGIASSIDKNGICHVWYSYTRSGPSTTCYLAYGTFDTAEPEPVIIQSTNLVIAPAPIERISAAVDPQTGSPHVVWESGGEILYRFKVGNLWVPAISVSETTTPSVFPGLAMFNEVLHLVWQEETVGGSEIFYRSKSGGSWSETSNLSVSPGSSVEPTVTGPVNGGPLVVWSDDTGGLFDLHYSVPATGAGGVLGSTMVQSRYPVSAIRGIRAGTRVLVLCTDGAASLYEVVTVKKDFAHASAAMNMAQQHSVREAGISRLGVANSPNPFNPTTTIRCEVPSAGIVSLKVYDVIGREVATLVDGFRERGAFTAVFDATDLPSGVYLYRLQHGRESLVRRMILVK